METGIRIPVDLLWCLTFLCLPTFISAAVLTPPYFNLAQGRKITATATCGYGDGVPLKELYCRLAGAATSGHLHGREPSTGELIQGQLCDYCDPTSKEKDHRVEFATDGTERWWQSPPLSRLGDELHKVNVTINLGQEFHVAYVYMRMANSPRPAIWVLERSKDFGKTWLPWQYFGENPSICMSYFNTTADQQLTSDTQVLCVTEFSDVVPLSNGEIVVSLVNGRPNAHNFSYADELQEWTRATDIRLRLLRVRTLQAHLMAIAGLDQTVTRRYYYSIKDISIGGRCVCNGHAESCDVQDPKTSKLLCSCIHNTCGEQCERCCPGFTQKKWRRALVDQPFLCEPCQCYGHSNECIYDETVDNNRQSIDIHGDYEGGGVCQNCRDNTMGINCEQCIAGFFRPEGVPRNATDACRPCECDLTVSTGECEEGSGRCLCRPEYAGDLCDRCSFGYYGYPECIPCYCHVNGTEGSVCIVASGSCPCKYNYKGDQCNQCAPGYYNFPECKPCSCDNVGSASLDCDPQSGQCQCMSNFAGRDCNECANGYYNFPSCQICNCDQKGTKEEVCDKGSGECLCNDRYTGGRCDSCVSGFYQFPKCLACGCAIPGSVSKSCDKSTGQCQCASNFGGRNCEHCYPGYYKYPECASCRCDQYGSLGQTCNQTTGQCSCMSNFIGPTCGKCGDNFYNYPYCEVCNCNPDGAKEIPGHPLGGCGIVTSGLLCECKDKVMGKICDTCKPGYWRLDRQNPEGCQTCGCNIPGTLAGVSKCDMNSGQCECKPHVSGQNCNLCIDGFYNLQEGNPFGCVDCACDPGGSLGRSCSKITGNCFCKPRITGQKCDKAEKGHYVPTLQQYKYEVEDGKTPEGARIRYGYELKEFPNFSWRGYAVLTKVQPEVRFVVDIRKPSLYQAIYRYVNKGSSTVKGSVTFTPESSTESKQSGEINLLPTKDPRFVTVSNADSRSFVLNIGNYTVSTNTPDYILLDYFVLVPNPYYEASKVQQKVTNPCLAPNDPGPCVHFKYPNLEGHPTGLGKTGYVVFGDSRGQARLNPDYVLTTLLGSQGLVQINEKQSSFMLDITVPKPDEYLIFINYHNPGAREQELDVEVGVPSGTKNSVITLASCPFSTLCRQVLREPEGWEAVFNITTGQATLSIKSRDGGRGVDLYIDSAFAVPKNEYHHDLIMPKTVCVEVNGSCVPSLYGQPVGTILIDFEQSQNLDIVSKSPPPDIIDPNIGLVHLKPVNQTSCPISDENKTDQCQTEIVPSVVSLELHGKVANDGQYVFIIHYYMPTEAVLTIPVSVLSGEKKLKGVFSPRFCPNTAGCRATLQFDESRNNLALLTPTNITAVFNGTKFGQIWLDYMLIVPKEQYNSDFLDILPLDKSKDFLLNCVDEGFQIRTDNKFCKEGAFTLTTNFNNGALECNCNAVGSRSFNCDTFGGFCQCKDNIIGRTCSACRPGFYGFPNCKPCNCPFGVCHDQTGQCMCPPLVEGSRCEKCKPKAYGYHELIGCHSCECNPEGVENLDLNCDQLTGECRCKANVGGRRCNTCIAGSHSFPDCKDCECDSKGTRPEICDKETSICFCKENVKGRTCDTCVDGTFNLDADTPKGCTKCFCFGHTTRCESSDSSWYEITTLTGWQLSNFKQVYEEAETVSAYGVTDGMEDQGSVYWIAPEAYLKKKINSYGGKLHYTVYVSVPDDKDVVGIIYPDVKITGNNMTIVHIHDKQPRQNQNLDAQLKLVQYNFVHDGTNAPVSREQFMMILFNIESLQIRATYFSQVSFSSLKNVRMEVATVNGFGERAKSVEECLCPPNYRGASCEDCAPGYYRSRLFPYLGICLKCDCNGHSESCDVNTGECHNCQNNTTGLHCEKCIAGYYGDPETGPCHICSCPLPYLSNNFATSCSVNEKQGGLECSCHTGYDGSNCESCASGYYGKPNEIGGLCQLCDCSRNIDMSDRSSCDMVTGACLKCEGHTAGAKCEHCQDWYWGEAVHLKNCQKCSCNTCGSELCFKDNGNCLCKPNIEGKNCDICAKNTWGFDYCDGCRDCECGAGAVTEQCDQISGVCTCQPGVEGEKCDRCKPGYWNLGVTGCQACECQSDGAQGCDPMTGRCLCLPGVTGERCDRCLPRWVLLPNRGCQECDYCIHLLIDDLDDLSQRVNVINRELHSVSVGAGAFNRLSLYKEKVSTFRPSVDNLSTAKDDEFKEILASLNAVLEEHTNVVKLLHDQSEAVAIDAKSMPQEITDLMEETDEVLKTAYNLTLLGNETLRLIDAVDKRLMEPTLSRNQVYLVPEGQQILHIIESQDFTARNLSSIAEKENAQQVLGKVSVLKESTMSNLNYSMKLSQDIDAIENRLSDLHNNTHLSSGNIQEALGIINRLKAVQLENLKRHQQTIGNVSKERKNLIQASEQANNLGAEFYDKAEADIQTIETNSSKLDAAIPILENKTTTIELKMEAMVLMTNESRIRAQYLKLTAEELNIMYDDTRYKSGNTVQAGQAYKVIQSSITLSDNSSEMAFKDSKNSLDELSDFEANATNSRKRSDLLDLSARSWETDTNTKYKDELSDAERNLKNAEEDLDKVSKALTSINTNLDRLNDSTVAETSKRIKEKVANVSFNVEEALAKTERIRKDSASNSAKMDYIQNNRPKANENLRDVEHDVVAAENNIPKIHSELNSSARKVNDLLPMAERLSESVALLREQIARARDEANRIKVGLNLLGNTTLTLRNPAKLEDTGSFTRLSVYFNTTQPDSLLVYIGDNLSTRQTQDGEKQKRSTSEDVQKDFLALEIRDGKVVFTFNLGSGPAKLVSNIQVNDGNWHQAIAERIGKSGKLTVRSVSSDFKDTMEEVEGSSSGAFSVLELSAAKSIFLVGGVPDYAEIPSELTTQAFVGGMEDLKLDNEPVGLWNFVKGENNNQGYNRRNVMQEIFTEGFYFNGMGYAALGKESFQIKGDRTKVSFQFKTYAADGLLFYLGKKDYFSVELNSGHIVFRFDLGSGAAVTRSSDVYNNGSWTLVSIERNSKTGVMNINNNVESLTVESKGNLKTLETDEDIYIGGIDSAVAPPREITTKPFEGCLKDITVGTLSVNPMESKRSKGLIRGCPEAVYVVTFPLSKSGYIALPQVDVGSTFDVTFKIKTKELNGLLLYASDVTQRNAFAVLMSEGQIKVVEVADNVKSELASQQFTYNDGIKWHYISIMKLGKELTMSIDDTNVVQSSNGPEQISFTTPLYMGGIPSSLTASSDIFSMVDGFSGCIGDITINKKFQNLANLQESKGVSLADCPAEKQEVTVVSKCALPAITSETRTVDNASGTRFGLTLKSRTEYKVIQGRHRSGPFTITATFKTSATDGIIFYASDIKHVDHVIIYMVGGRVFFGIDFGTGTALMSSAEKYNDNEWHTVRVVRSGKNGTLFVDGKQLSKGTSPKIAATLNVLDPQYVGGLPESIIKLAQRNMKNITFTGFHGCIKDLTIDNANFPKPVATFDTVECSSFDEVGAFFGLTGGYLTLAEKFKVHMDMDIQLEVRPRTQEGVLLSVHNKTDLVVLQISGGNVVFTVDNGAGPITVKHKAASRFTLCDGNWHKIHAIKTGNNVTLTVDGKSFMEQGSKTTASAADTNDPLYLGGLPDESAKGVVATGRYAGCIRNVYINNRFYSLYIQTTGDVRNDGCPLE